MCPACLTTAAWLIGGTSSAGGAAALIAIKLRARKSASKTARPAAHQGDRHESSESRKPQ